MVYITKYKEHSRIPKKEIEKMQKKYKKELLQPRVEGELNPKFLSVYGTKNIRVSEHDIKKMEKKNPRYAKKLEEVWKRQRGRK